MQLKWPMLWDLFSLFPAYAGVIQKCRLPRPTRFSFPRIRGGDPILPDIAQMTKIFSPHTRG